MLINLKNSILVFFLLFNSLIFSQEQKTAYVVEVAGLHDSLNYHFVENQQLYKEGWDTLVQPKFWRTLMTMGEDSALINVGSTRQIINKIAVSDWNKLTKEDQSAIRDSVKVHYGLAEEEHVYMTSGKKEYIIFQKLPFCR